MTIHQAGHTYYTHPNKGHMTICKACKAKSHFPARQAEALSGQASKGHSIERAQGCYHRPLTRGLSENIEPPASNLCLLAFLWLIMLIPVWVELYSNIKWIAKVLLQKKTIDIIHLQHLLCAPFYCA